jgi:hypothetical protein
VRHRIIVKYNRAFDGDDESRHNEFPDDGDG